MLGSGPLASMPARLAQLLGGLVLYGVGLSLYVLAGLGLDPWDAFHQGLSRQTHVAIGTWAILVGFAVLLLWIPMRLRPGIGTIANAVVIGLVMNAVLAVAPAPQAMPLRVLLLVLGTLMSGVATGAYIGAGLGPGPRDGIMVGIAARGHSLRLVRTCIEATVLVAGFLLGGTIGAGTVVYALSIGPIAHVTIPAFTRTGASVARPAMSEGTA